MEGARGFLSGRLGWAPRFLFREGWQGFFRGEFRCRRGRCVAASVGDGHAAVEGVVGVPVRDGGGGDGFHEQPVTLGLYLRLYGGGNGGVGDVRPQFVGDVVVDVDGGEEKIAVQIVLTAVLGQDYQDF